MARRERDQWQQAAESAKEEANANEAAAQRTRTQLEALSSQQRRDVETLSGRDAELREAQYTGAGALRRTAPASPGTVG